MPRHHATRLELANLAEHPSLAELQAHTVRFTLELLSRDLVKVPRRDEWRATYHARVIDVRRAEP
jgi:hypothetical protein